jgi:hypothetical protein
MRIRIPRCDGRIAAFCSLMGILALPALAADDTLPWSFVNGSAKGYSIHLESASPVPGTHFHVGETIEFKITVSYRLTIADNGTVVLIFQDENNKSLSAGNPQKNLPVPRGDGTVTLEQSFVVPADGNEVRLFIPLVPNGLKETDGELVLRYPVSHAAKSATIGYPSVAAALADLHANPDVQFRDGQGWTFATDKGHNTVWSFPPEGHLAYPYAVRTVAVDRDGGTGLDVAVLCESTQSACDKLIEDFKAQSASTGFA